MLVKKVKYTDYKGNQREEELYFNLSKAEVAEMELSHQGGLSEKINRIVATQDSKEIIELFKDLIVKSYGVVSDDGRRFIKNDQLREEFVQTEAYSELFMELASDADEAAKFVNGIIPQVENKKQVTTK
jgi:hypothetical protein